MARKILCVAEKPSIAKSVAQHLSGGQVTGVSEERVKCRRALNYVQSSIAGTKFVKNYDFNFDFGQPWGQCPVTMTSVIGHLTNVEFPQQYRKWTSCPPGQLFDCPVNVEVDNVYMIDGETIFRD